MQHQYFPVNWVDGMKINKSHFIAQNNAYTHQVAQGVSSVLNEYNYGLLPNTLNSGNDLKLFVSIDNQQQVQIRLQKCRAITFGGYAMQSDEDTFMNTNPISTSLPDLSIPFDELKGKSSEYFIVLVINPYERIAYGDADPVETPLRIPYTRPTYQVQLTSINEKSKNVLGFFQIPVGRLFIREQRVLLDEKYIPPCCSVSSHFDLLKLHAELEKFFGKIELYSLQIIQKILQKKQQNNLAIILQKICEQIALFTASNNGFFKLINLYQPPVFLINTACSFARLLKNTLDVYSGSGKEELINYFMKWCDVSQGELEGAIKSLANHNYNHLDINNSVEQVSYFVGLINGLFTELSKLEYIGERKESEIFIPGSEKVQPKTRTTFLAE